MNAWDVQAGIQRDFEFLGLNKLGETSFWGGYERINDGLASVSLGGNFPDNGKNFGGIPADRYLAANTIIGIDVPTEITGSMVDRWSLALDQAVDSANMHVYTVFQHLTPEVDLVTKDPAVSHHGKLAHVNAPLDDFDLLYNRRANLLLIQSDGGRPRGRPPVVAPSGKHQLRRVRCGSATAL